MNNEEEYREDRDLVINEYDSDAEKKLKRLRQKFANTLPKTKSVMLKLDLVKLDPAGRYALDEDSELRVLKMLVENRVDLGLYCGRTGAFASILRTFMVSTGAPSLSKCFGSNPSEERKRFNQRFDTLMTTLFGEDTFITSWYCDGVKFDIAYGKQMKALQKPTQSLNNKELKQACIVEMANDKEFMEAVLKAAGINPAVQQQQPQVPTSPISAAPQKYCTACGNEIAATAKFCPHCGTNQAE